MHSGVVLLGQNRDESAEVLVGQRVRLTAFRKIHGVDFPTILSEARKYRLTLVIATQTLAQLPPACLSAVFGNCATVVSLRVGGEDAKVLRGEFSTAIAASQLQDLPDSKSNVRTLMGGRPIGPHLVNTFPPAEETGEETPSGRLVRASLERFARAAVEIADRIPVPPVRDSLCMYSMNKGACDG